jgi:acetyl esterase/lipase
MIRFYLVVFFFLISLLSFCKAPEYHLWLLAIGVTEFPLVFAGISTLLTLWGVWVQKYQLAGTVLGLITLIIFLSPIVRAYWISKHIEPDMVKSFTNISGPNQPVLFTSDTPFSFWKMFKRKKDVPYKTLTYVKYIDTSMSMDFYQAKTFNPSFIRPQIDLPEVTPDKAPCVIIVHGGSWAGGDSKQLPELNSYLAAKGYNVAAINYRLAPKYQTPAPVEDIQAAIAYLKQHAGELHIDTTKFVLLGRSAGAQIATLAAYTIHEPALKGVIDFYGPEDMVWGYSIPSSPLIMDSRKVMRNYIGGPYEEVPEKYVACSPLEFVNKLSVPTLIIHGENDVLVSPEHSRRLNKKLDDNHIKHYYLKLPWATHGFDYNINGPGGQLSTYAVETFLNTITQ